MIQFNEKSIMKNVFVSSPKYILFKDSILSEVVVSSKAQFFYVNSLMAPWIKQETKYRNQPRFRATQAIRDLLLGIEDGFPLCCILHFCWDTLWKGLDETKRVNARGFKHTINGTPYVPCFYHSSNRKVIK